MSHLTSPAKDFPKWYQEIVELADLAEHSAVKGCMVIKPYGYAIWELLQRELDRQIKAAGVSNVYFPLFIPESFINREKEHVKGFAPECAVVTEGGGKKLGERLVLRPTSETVMYDTFSRWIKSHRDLPLKINQWANVIRWEMRPRLFLRTIEFLWQEGHTAHATEQDAIAETNRALEMYKNFGQKYLALPVVTGRKTEKEKFAGALYTLCAEVLARDGKSIQAGTSHNLGQNFAKSFNVQFQDAEKKLQYVWQTSWGVSTRLIGTLIVVHGDELGLKLPPAIAPFQAVIIPIWRSSEEEKTVKEFIEKICAIFKGLTLQFSDDLKENLRWKFDDREDKNPGFKFNEWEVKGVPIRIEVGPKDVEKNQVILARRDTREKIAIQIDQLAKELPEILLAIQKNLFTMAENFQKKHTHEINDLNKFKEIIETVGGFIYAPWCSSHECEFIIKNLTKATIRCIPEFGKGQGKCIRCGEPAKERALFAKAY